jgi:putative transcriptional regulator
MIRVKLQDVLDKEERSLKWVSTKTGIAYSTLHKLNNNNTNAISFNTMDKICTLFNCKLEDILEFVNDSNKL